MTSGTVTRRYCRAIAVGVALLSLVAALASTQTAAAAPRAFKAGAAAGSAHIVPVAWGRGGGFGAFRGGFADHNSRFFRGRFFDRDDRFFRGRFLGPPVVFNRPLFRGRPFFRSARFFWPWWGRGSPAYAWVYPYNYCYAYGCY